jgi:MFS family permease
VASLAFCNLTVYYNLFGYLRTLGIPAELGGLVIGAYSLSAMVLYLLGSPFLTAANAPPVMWLGTGLLAASGLGYLAVHSLWGLLLLRVLNGAGQFCIGAGAMALLVAVIPPERSGQAFGIYSVAVLVAYGAVPAIMDALAPFIPTPPHGYAAATLPLVPAAWIVWRIHRRRRERPPASHPGHLPRWTDIRADVTDLPVVLLLLLNMSYFANWSSLFFLFKGFAEQQGLANVGTFFTVASVPMIAMRLLAGRLFDVVDKGWLTVASFLIIALGHLALDRLPVGAVPLAGAVFGLGLGAGFPAINGLMFEVSPPRFRSLNANLMLFAVQAGFFLGPVAGGAQVARRGYHGYFLLAGCLALAAAGLGAALVCQRRAQRRARAVAG